MPRKILVVDDEENIRKFLPRSFAREGHDVLAAGSAGEAREVIAQHGVPDAVILDVRLPDASGLDLLRELKQSHGELIVIMITAFGEVEDSVNAIKNGAYDYVQKPFDFAEINRRVKNALEKLDLRDQVERLQAGSGPGYAGLIGESPSMREVVRVIERVAQSATTTVLITGETGTGKELVARAVHDRSSRGKGPFLAVNCTTLSENLLESELFGHERGAFTDAKTTKHGLFEVARGGTVFLDEISEMDVKLQSRILRVLENRTFRMVGGTKDIATDVRIVAATNRALEELVKSGQFREDLYFRLRVVPIHVPPLRERGNDILLLAQFFLHKFTRELSRKVKGFTDTAREALLRYPWPGNVRELRNAVEHSVLLTDAEEIGVADLNPEIARDTGGLPPLPAEDLPIFRDAKEAALSRFEQKYLVDILAHHRGNVSRAAAAAGLDRSSLQRLLRKHNIQSDEFRSRD